MKMFFRKKHIVSTDVVSKTALQKFFHHKTSLISVVFIGLLFLVALLGYVITPDSTPYANRQLLELSTKKPGFSVSMLAVRNNSADQKASFFSRMLFGEKSDFKLIPIQQYHFTDSTLEYNEYSDESESVSKSIAISDIVYAVSPESKQKMLDKSTVSWIDLEGKTHVEKVADLKQKIIKDHILKQTFWLGTDLFGRDYLSQLIIGARVSLSVGFISVMISLLIGVLLGSLAGYFKGWVDNLIMWFINVVWSIPTLLLVIAITFALGKGFWQVFIAIGLTMWVEVARVVRGQIISIRELEYVEAARALGFSNLRIIFRHILPNVTSSIIIISAANFASAILIEAGLSFLGIGVQPPMPSWGMMIKENYRFIILDSPYLAIVPGLAIMLVVLAFMVIGNQLRDVLNVKEQ